MIFTAPDKVWAQFRLLDGFYSTQVSAEANYKGLCFYAWVQAVWKVPTQVPLHQEEQKYML